MWAILILTFSCCWRAGKTKKNIFQRKKMKILRCSCGMPSNDLGDNRFSIWLVVFFFDGFIIYGKLNRCYRQRIAARKALPSTEWTAEHGKRTSRVSRSRIYSKIYIRVREQRELAQSLESPRTISIFLRCVETILFVFRAYWAVGRMKIHLYIIRCLA